MPIRDITLPVWNKTPVLFRAVQGEADSRTITVTLLDSGGQPVDLTNASARLYIRKPDKTSVFMDGTVTDAPGGVCSFTLLSGAVSAAGTADCQILISWPDNRSLKAVGLSLEILPSNFESAVESSNEFSALVTELNRVSTAADTAEKAAADCNSAAEAANTATANADSASASAISAANSANTAASSATTAAASADSGAASANSAAENANNAATAANASKSACDTAAQQADTAAENANAKADAADSAALAANAAASDASNAAHGATEVSNTLNPFTGKMDTVSNIIHSYENLYGIAAEDFDNIGISAQEFDDMNIPALEFDFKSDKIFNRNCLTALEFDNLGLTMQEFETVVGSKNMTAQQFDSESRLLFT